MICPKCNAPMADGAAFCTNCGAAFSVPVPNTQAPYVPVEQVSQPPVPGPMGAVTDWKNSKFDGGFWGLFGVNLLLGLVTVISLGFAYPAMYCFRLRWVYRHTVIGGYRLKFNGSGAQLFGKYILWTFLSIITLGIYSLWLPINYQRWVTKHIEIDRVEN